MQGHLAQVGARVQQAASLCLLGPCSQSAVAAPFKAVGGRKEGKNTHFIKMIDLI